MSTKMTILGTKDFHFYEDCFQTNYLFLDVNMGCRHCISMTHVGFSRAQWEALRQTEPTKFNLVNKSRKEILADVESQVDENIAKYETDKDNKNLHSMVRGLYELHGYDKPRDEQIAETLKNYLTRQKWQRKILRDAKKILAEK